MISESKNYRVIGGSHDGEIFTFRPNQSPGSITVLAYLSMLHRTDDTLRELYIGGIDRHGYPVLRHLATHDKNLPSDLFLPFDEQSDR